MFLYEISKEKSCLISEESKLKSLLPLNDISSTASSSLLIDASPYHMKHSAFKLKNSIMQQQYSVYKTSATLSCFSYCGP
ncbi:hypothetical protein ACB092_07G102000 [Castanea dentata]